MPYYGAGDYYQGDYYQGDPGIFGTLAKIGKGALGIASRVFLPPAVSAVGRALVARDEPQVPVPRGFPQAIPRPGLGGAMERFLPGGASGFIAGSPYVCAPDGMRRGHFNKSTYTVRGGGTSRWSPVPLECPVIIPKGSTCVGPRRMNVANPRALRRALRRAAGFAKLARRYVRITTGFKKGKRRKK